VFGAGAADLGELLFEGLASAMDTDGRVACGDSDLLCESIEGGVGQIDAAEDFAVGGLHGEDGFGDALADNLVGLRIGGGFGEVLRPAFEGSVFGGAVAVVVDDCVAEDAVEPGCGGLLFA
jgi:hypothetical protein